MAPQAAGLANSDVNVTIGALGCVVLAWPEHQMKGQTLQVAARALAAGGGHGAGSECVPGHLRLRGLESGGFVAAACHNPAIMLASGGEPGAASALDGVPAGAAYLTLESSCHQPAVATLAFSSESSFSGDSSSFGVRGSGEGGHGPWSRKLLQQGSTDSADPPQAPPLEQQASNSSGDSSEGDKYDPFAQPQQDGGISMGCVVNVTDGSGTNSTEELACWCRFRNNPLPFDPQANATASCCCGTKQRCGVGTDLLSKMCGNRSTCGVILVVVGVFVVFMVAVCIMGGFCWKRRRPGAEVQLAAASRRGPQAAADAECEALLALPAEKLAEVLVRRPAEGDVVYGTSVDCPICLEPVQISVDSWRLFPCSHGTCTTCMVDLVRHNRRRVPEHKRVVHCSLCRTLAVVPRDILPEDVVLVQQAPAGAGPQAQPAAGAAPAEAAAAATGAEEAPAAAAPHPAYVYFGRFALRF